MASNDYNLVSGDNWTQVATSGEDFLVDNISSSIVYYTLQDSAPNLSEAAVGIIKPEDGLIRMGLSGSLYLRIPDHESSAKIIVST